MMSTKRLHVLRLRVCVFGLHPRVLYLSGKSPPPSLYQSSSNLLHSSYFHFTHPEMIIHRLIVKYLIDRLYIRIYLLRDIRVTHLRCGICRDQSDGLTPLQLWPFIIQGRLPAGSGR